MALHDIELDAIEVVYAFCSRQTISKQCTLQLIPFTSSWHASIMWIMETVLAFEIEREAEIPIHFLKYSIVRRRFLTSSLRTATYLVVNGNNAAYKQRHDHIKMTAISHQYGKTIRNNGNYIQWENCFPRVFYAFVFQTEKNDKLKFVRILFTSGIKYSKFLMHSHLVFDVRWRLFNTNSIQ